MFGWFWWLFGRGSSQPTQSVLADFAPDVFDLRASTRNSNWSLRWESSRLVYRELLPPLDLFPKPGSKPEEPAQIDVGTSAPGWQSFWGTVNEVGAWDWSGDFSWNDKIKVMGGEHWEFDLQRGEKHMK